MPNRPQPELALAGNKGGESAIFLRSSEVLLRQREGYLVFRSAIFQILRLWFLMLVVTAEMHRVRRARFAGFAELYLLI